MAMCSLNSSLGVLVRPLPEVVAAKLSLLTISGQRSRQGTKIQIPVNGNIKHGAHSLDASLTESVFARYFYETQWRAG